MSGKSPSVPSVPYDDDKKTDKKLNKLSDLQKLLEQRKFVNRCCDQLIVKPNSKQHTRFSLDSYNIKVTVTRANDNYIFKTEFKDSITNHSKKNLSKLKLVIDKDGEYAFGSISGSNIDDIKKKYTIINKSKHDKIRLTVKTNIYGFSITLKYRGNRNGKLTISLVSEPVTNHFVSYVNYLTSWWPPEAIAASIGVPPYSHTYSYNTINLSFWTTNQGPVDAALLWCNAITYVSPQNPWGTTTQEIQQAWISLYHQYNVKVLVSAFGATDFPTTQGTDPITVAEELAQFCIDNNLDGVDLDWEDNAAMETGTGEPWLISCTQKLRELLPSPYIISHAPQAPYFMGVTKYPNGGYLKINQEVGDDIDFYNIQFYNQDSSTYDTYDTLFNASNGWATNTAVKQIANQSVDKSKLVVGKGVKPDDFFNTGYVPVDDLASYLKQGVDDGYSAGFMGWQFSSDTTGSWSATLAASFPQS